MWIRVMADQRSAKAPKVLILKQDERNRIDGSIKETLLWNLRIDLCVNFQYTENIDESS